MKRDCAVPGYTLVELAIVIAVVAILAAAAFVALRPMDEERDIALVRSSQASLQNIVSQASVREDTATHQLGVNQVRSALVEHIVQTDPATDDVVVQVAGVTAAPVQPAYIRVTISNKRGVLFGLDNGNIVVTSLCGFRNYSALNGTIQKGPGSPPCS